VISLALKIVLSGLALSGVATAGYVFYSGVLSPDNWVYQGGAPTSWKDGGVYGAPGPVAGTGLPFIVIGYGAYWLHRRYRRKPE
jgi:hypothetical protein